LLAPWEGCAPLRLDWLAGKNFTVLQEPKGIYGPPQVIDKLCWNGKPVSDHNPLVVDLMI
jgi:hypothetical protein